VAGGPGFVRRGASVFAGVSGRDSIDRQDAETLALRDRELICILGGYRLAVECPGNVHREVPLENGAGRRDRLARVHRLVAEREREDLRSNCDRGSRVRNSVVLYSCRCNPLADLRGRLGILTVLAVTVVGSELRRLGARMSQHERLRQCDDAKGACDEL